MVDPPHPDWRGLVQLVSADLHATTPGQQLEAVVVRCDLGRCRLGGAPPRPEKLRRDRSRRRSPRCERMSLLGAMPRSQRQHSRTTRQSGLKRFQYPVVVRGSSQVEIEANGSEILEVLTPESEHWRGLQLDPNDRLLIRRSLVRAQVGEPIKPKGNVASRNPFLFAILESDPDCPISSTSPRSYRQNFRLSLECRVCSGETAPAKGPALATRRSHQHL